jgi:dienelactone hydrolase
MCHPDGPSNAAELDVRTEEASVPVGDAQMPAFHAAPRTDGVHPMVLVIGDIYGARSPFYEHLAELLAASGFDAYVPEYFFRAGELAEKSMEAAFERKGRLDEHRVLDDLEAAVERLRKGDGRVGIVGFCLGGSLALNLAARRDDLATVCYYGFPAGPPGPPGDPSRTAARPLDEVDAVNGPILGFWGSEDARVGMDNVAAYADALTGRGVDFRHSILPGLDHGFLAAAFESDDATNAARATWNETIDFLRAQTATRA